MHKQPLLVSISLTVIAIHFGCDVKPTSDRHSLFNSQGAIQETIEAEVNQDIAPDSADVIMEHTPNREVEEKLAANNCAQADFTEFTFENSVKPLLDKYCVSCHLGENVRGSTSFQQYYEATEVSPHTFIWYKAEENIKNGLMPPNASQPVDECMQLAFSAWIGEKQSVELHNSFTLRLMSPSEYDLTVSSFLEEPFEKAQKQFSVGSSETTYFDNQQNLQTLNAVRIAQYESLANEISETFFSKNMHPNLVSSSCADKFAEKNEVCLNEFLLNTSKKLISKPLSNHDQVIAALLGNSEITGLDAYKVLLEIVLRDSNFVFRLEDPLSDELSPMDYLRRISFLIWGAPPSQALVSQVEGKGYSEIDFEAIVDTLLSDERARSQINNFFSQWFGYRKFKYSEDALLKDLYLESNKLIEKVIFEENKSVLDLLGSLEAYLTPRLSDHYGADFVPTVPEPQFATLPAPRGIFHHGSVLADAQDITKTSITMRGKFLSESILCKKIPPPPPVNLDDLKAQVAHDCAIDSTLAIWDTPSCAGCHQFMDNIGLGLFVHGPLGQFRDVQPDNDQCKIDRPGEIEGYGKFLGADELSAAIKSNPGDFTSCAVQQVLAFSEQKNTFDIFNREIDIYKDAFVNSNYSFQELLKAIALSDHFKRKSVK